jgi:hypothetical protein
MLLVADGQVQARVGDADDLATHRVRGPVAGECACCQARRVDDDVRAEVEYLVESGDPAQDLLGARAPDLPVQVRQVGGHLHQRDGVAQPARVARRQLVGPGRAHPADGGRPGR